MFVIIITIAAIKKVNVFSSFGSGAKEGLKFTFSILPTLVAVFAMCALMEASGISRALAKWLEPAFSFLGIPEELSRLALIKPFSGSGSLSLLTDVLKEYGPDSYISRCACTIYSSSETVFYVFALYLSGTDRKSRAAPLAIVIFTTILSCILSCLLCRVM